VLRSWAPGSNAAQVAALEALVVSWRGQGPVALPGGIRVSRVSGRIGRVPCPDERNVDRP